MDQHDQAIRRVLIVKGDSGFEEGLESMLTKHGRGLQVIGIHYSDDQRFLLTMQQEQPDVLLLFEGGRLEAWRVLELLRDAPLRVITLSANRASLELYERVVVPTGKIQDLIALIRQRTDAGWQSLVTDQVALAK